LEALIVKSPSTVSPEYRELALAALERASGPLTWLALAQLACVADVSSAYLEFAAALRELAASGKALRRGGPAGDLFSRVGQPAQPGDKRPGRLSRALTNLRVKHGLSQEQAALQLGWPPTRIVRLENSPDDEQKLGELKAYARLLRRDLFVAFAVAGVTSCTE
jgi:hypothetical protein